MRQRIIQLLHPVAILTTTCLLAACMDNNTGKGGGDGEATIELTLQLPATTGGAATRVIGAEPGEENNIVNAQVLAFIEKGTDWVYDYTATVKKIEDTQGGRSNRDMTITATVRELSVKQRFAVFANSAVEVAAINYIIPGKTIEEVERKIVSKNGSGEWPANINGAGTFTPFPMYAYTDAKTIDSGTNTIGTYPMIRMVARIDVALHDAIPSSNFILMEACLYNRMTSGYVSYRESAFDNVSAVTAPAVPTGGNAGTPPLEPKVMYKTTGTNKIERAIYAFEAEAITSESERTTKTALVISGYYNEDTSMKRYYRIDLKDDNLGSGNISDGILRNHLYKVEVQSVNGTGYATALEAYMGDARLTAVVRLWDLAKQNVMGDGQYKLDVETDTEGVFRRWVQGSTLTTVKAVTNYDIDYQGLFPGIYVDISKVVYDPAVTSGNEWIVFARTQNGDGALTREFTLEIDRAKVPHKSYSSIAKVPVTAGNMTKMVYMEYVNECYPEPHTGWAGSNIYWDGKNLTFDDVGVTAHEDYQGIFFQWGSLYGISPKEAWSKNTVIYAPDGTSGTASSKKIASAWGGSPWMPRAIDTAIDSYPPVRLGKTDRDRAYLYELSTADGGLGDTGDICMHLTKKGWAPAGKWRMPTSAEFGASGNYTKYTGGSHSSINDDGTTTFMEHRYRKDVTPQVRFPASGHRKSGNGELDFTGYHGEYWSASPNNMNSYCMSYGMEVLNLGKPVHRAHGQSVRCVKE